MTDAEDPHQEREPPPRRRRRRAPGRLWRRFDPLFTATLVNQIEPDCGECNGEYAEPACRSGIVINIQA